MLIVRGGSPLRGIGRNVAVYVFHINQPSLPTRFCSVLVSVSVLLVLSTIFHSIKSPDNCRLSHSVLPVLFLPYWSFQLYISSLVSLSPDRNVCGWLGLKRQLTNKSLTGGTALNPHRLLFLALAGQLWHTSFGFMIYSSTVKSAYDVSVIVDDVQYCIEYWSYLVFLGGQKQ